MAGSSAEEGKKNNGPQIGEEVAVGIEDVSTIPKGTIDPVYEAKARVLNRAVGFLCLGLAQVR